MKDIFGREIIVGDLVAFNPPYYKGLTEGYIQKINTKMVTINYEHQGNWWNVNVYPSDVCVCLERREA